MKKTILTSLLDALTERPLIVNLEGPEARARAILKMLKKPTMPFSSQYRNMIENRLQPKKRTPKSGIVLTATRNRTDIGSTRAMIDAPGGTRLSSAGCWGPRA